MISEEKWETKIKCLAYLLQVIECRRLLQVIYQIMLKNLTKVNSCVKFKSIFHKMCQKDNIILLAIHHVSWNFINCCLLIFCQELIHFKLHVQNLTLLLLGISMTLHKCPKNQAKGKKRGYSIHAWSLWMVAKTEFKSIHHTQFSHQSIKVMPRNLGGIVFQNKTKNG